jgi:hypothetical protein
MNRTLIYMLLFVLLAPGFLLHLGAPPSGAIRLKSVLIHAMVFAGALVAYSALSKAYPALEGFQESGPAPLPEPIAKETPPTRRN